MVCRLSTELQWLGDEWIVLRLGRFEWLGTKHRLLKNDIL